MSSRISATNTNISYPNQVTAGAITEPKFGFTDITTANSTTSQHGLLKKLDGTSTDYFGGDGNWHALPASGGGTPALETGEIDITSASLTDVVSIDCTQLHNTDMVKIYIDIRNGSDTTQSCKLYINDGTNAAFTSNELASSTSTPFHNHIEIQVSANPSGTFTDASVSALAYDDKPAQKFTVQGAGSFLNSWITLGTTALKVQVASDGSHTLGVTYSVVRLR